MNISDVKGRVDFGILTIREDEFGAVLHRLPKLDIVEARRRYRIRQLPLGTGESYTIATLHCVEQGNTEALNTARDLLEDLDPRFLLVVGIAGGVPADEFTLGDVIVSTRIIDFSVEAVLRNHEHVYALGGGLLHPDAARLAADIRAMVDDGELVGWNTRDAIDMDRPLVKLADADFYGDNDWQKDTRAKLKRHFANKAPRPSLVVTGAIASSDRLIKEAETLQSWLKIARQIQAVEMESAGIYKAAHGRSTPFLAIRGISDIVGFKRHPDWTEYACRSAASFMRSFLLARPIKPCAAGSMTRTSESMLGARQVASSPTASAGPVASPADVATGQGLPRTGHGGELSMMDTGALLEAAIGRDAYLAAEAAIEIQKRGPDETKRIFDGDWQKAPECATTENFLRDVFHTFGENFAHHLVDVLEEGARNAVNVAVYAFPRASILPQGPRDRLYSWASRQVNGRLGDWGTMVLPMIAVGSAGLAAYAWDVIKRADDKRDSICGETLVRLFVQADSRNDAGSVLGVMGKLIQNAHDEHWPNPQFLLTRLPAWPLTSAAVDSLIERGLAADQLQEIRRFASEALICAGARRVVIELVQRIQRNQINRADAIRLIAHLGGPQAAQFVSTVPSTPLDQALVLPWLIPTLDASAIDAVLRDEENRFLVSRALGLAKTKADWIESVLGSTNWLNRGYAGLGLAYARGSEAKRALLDALDAMHGEGSEAVHERILLNTALVVAGAHEHAQEILRWLPAHSQLREDLAKQDVLAALSIALGRDHLAVRAWRRVGCAPARLDPEVSQHAAF